MTEREKVLLRREGARITLDRYIEGSSSEARRIVNELFPLPKATKPREVVIGGGTTYRLNPALEYRTLSGAWVRSTREVEDCDADELRAFADLRDHPTEEVEDEDD